MFLSLAAAAPALAQTQRDWTNNQPVRYPDPDVVAVDKSFGKYQIFNAVVYRHYVGTKWAEGPAWCAQEHYLIWSDIPNNRQLRFLEEDGHATTFHSPSGYSNGNTFDFEGRQISCEHAGRRVVRYEHNGTVATIAEKYAGKPLNSPNDVVVHPDGSIWFTDPPYGIRADVDGNIWAGANGGAGYDGVHVFSPAGQRIGMILLPEICANLCFGGAKRNRLFMAASQSLYSVYLGTQGAHIT